MNRKSAALLIAFGVILSAVVNNLGDLSRAFLGVLGVFKPLILGLAMAFVLNVPLGMLETWDKKKRLPRWVGVMLSLLLILAIIACALLILAPQLYDAGAALVAKLPEWAESLKQAALRVYDDPRLSERINSLSIDWDRVAGNVTDFLRTGAFDWISSAAGVASGVVGGITSVIVAFIIALGAVSCKERLCGQISRTTRAFLKPNLAEKLIGTTRMVHHAYAGFFTAQLTESVILGLLVAIGMLIIGFPRPFMVSTLVSVGALVPLFGAFVAAVLAAFLLAAEFSLAKGAWFLVFFIALQQIEGNVIYPRVMGKRIGLPAIWVLIAVVTGGNALGVLGMILFVPLVSVVYQLIAKEVRRRENNV